MQAMEKDTGFVLKELRVDGGASRDQFLMQFQADIMGKRLMRPAIRETTALGAALLAGLAAGFWRSLDEISKAYENGNVFEPVMDVQKRTALLHDWNRAVERCMKWVEN